jgi:hypothetical protein
MSAARLDAGREGEAGNGVADHLALTAAEAADGIAHEKDLGEVIAAQGGAPECLAGAILALDRDTVAGVLTEVRGAVVRGVGVLLATAVSVEFVLEFHV